MEGGGGRKEGEKEGRKKQIRVGEGGREEGRKEEGRATGYIFM